MSGEVLKPCPNPWCHSHERALPLTVIGIAEVSVVHGRIGYKAHCTDCGLRGPTVMRKADAFAAWNTRTPSDADRTAVVEEPHFIRRHGAWFRPDAAGYSSSLAGAGVYPKAEAEKYLQADGVTIHPAETCRDEIERILAGAERLRQALSTPAGEDRP